MIIVPGVKKETFEFIRDSSTQVQLMWFVSKIVVVIACEIQAIIMYLHNYLKQNSNLRIGRNSTTTDEKLRVFRVPIRD